MAPHVLLAAWADWLAQDADGAGWCFEAEPNQHDTGWYENEVGRYLKVGHDAPARLAMPHACAPP